MTERSRFRDQLLAVEPPPADLRDRLQQEIQTMFVRKLSVTSRAFISLIMVADFAAAVLCAWLLFTETTLPTLARVGLGTGVLFALAWGSWFVFMLRHGETNIRRDGAIMAGMVWTFTVLMSIFMIVVGATTEDRSKGMIVILQALFFLVGAAVYFLSQRIEAAQLNVTERLLKMELQLTELMQGRS